MREFIIACLTFCLILNRTSPQIVKCDYRDDIFRLKYQVELNISYYRCNLDTLNSSLDSEINEIIGDHENEQTENDVKYLRNSENSQLKIFSSIFCDKFKNLRAINFDNAQIEFIDEDAMQKCSNLKYLIIRCSKITDFPEYLLIRNRKLKFISIEKGQLSRLSENSFLNQRELEALELQNNQIIDLPLNIFKTLRKLKELKLHNNQIQAAHPGWFENLASLKYLALNGNQLTNIPSKIFISLVNLETLYLNENRIKSLYLDSFEGLQSLKVLNLAKNKISELPQRVFSNLINLEVSSLSSNMLTTIHSDSFGDQKKFTEVYLHSNRISSVDEKFIDNTALSYFDFKNNICGNFFVQKRVEIKPNMRKCFDNYQPRPEKEKCGKQGGAVGNIIGGSFITRGSFPWIAAMVYAHSGKYFCGGTIVSDQKIVTAAHCIQDKEKESKLLPNQLNVLLGIHNLSIRFEAGSRSVAIHNIHVHPAWNYKAERFDADIAVLVLDEVITFNRHIQPICILQPSSQAATINIGIVVGYGKSEDESKIHEVTPKIIDVPIHINEDCFLEFPDLARISSQRTFCGGHAEGTGVCLGDSGSGLIVKYNEAYYLRGIVSSSLRTVRWGCDVDKYSVFTDVLKYVDWISGIDVGDVYVPSN